MPSRCCASSAPQPLGNFPLPVSSFFLLHRGLLRLLRDDLLCQSCLSLLLGDCLLVKRVGPEDDGDESQSASHQGGQTRVPARKLAAVLLFELVPSGVWLELKVA